MELAVLETGDNVAEVEVGSVLGDDGPIGEAAGNAGSGRARDGIDKHGIAGLSKTDAALLLHFAVFNEVVQGGGRALRDELAAGADGEAVGGGVRAEEGDSRAGADGNCERIRS